jgi:ribosomal protein L22
MHISATLKSTSGSFLSDDFLVVLDERAKLKSSRLHKVRNRLFTLFTLYVNHASLTGRWPEKSVKFILRLLKNAESNADAKNIDLEDLFIKNIVVQQAPVR